MASNYGLNFGVRRMDDKNVTREARLRTPSAAPSTNGGYFLQGQLVQQDPNNPGYMMVSGPNTALIPGVVGLLISEDIWLRSIYEVDREGLDTFQMGLVKPNKQAQIVNGQGAKVWFKNTTAQTRPDGRVVAAVTMLGSMTGAVAGSSVLVWNGSQYNAAASGTSGAVATITYIDNTDPTQPYCEAVLLS